jgi:hypothetical protein
MNAKFSDLSVFIQEVLSNDLEKVEAERGVVHFVEETGDVLRFLDRRNADIWFDLRDTLRAQPNGLDPAAIDAMSVKITTFAESGENISDLPDDKKQILRFGRMVAERWQLRMIEENQDFKI